MYNRGGAIVTRDIPDNSVVIGVPARVIKTADEYFEKIKKESLHLGHLKYEEKDKALREYYGYRKNNDNISRRRRKQRSSNEDFTG